MVRGPCYGTLLLSSSERTNIDKRVIHFLRVPNLANINDKVVIYNTALHGFDKS